MSQDRAAFAGQIADVRVHDLLLTILEGRHTGVASFQTEIGSARVWFRDGDLVDADMGRHHMEAAVRRLLPLTTGSFEVEFKPIDRRRVISTTTADLIAPFVPPGAQPGAGTIDGDDAPTDVDPSGGDHPDPDRDRDEDSTVISAPPTQARSGARARRPAAGWRPTAGGGGRADAGATPTTEPEAVRDSLAAAASPSPRKTMSMSRFAPPSRAPVTSPTDDDARNRLSALRRAGPVPNDAMLGDVEDATAGRTADHTGPAPSSVPNAPLLDTPAPVPTEAPSPDAAAPSSPDAPSAPFSRPAATHAPRAPTFAAPPFTAPAAAGKPPAAGLTPTPPTSAAMAPPAAPTPTPPTPTPPTSAASPPAAAAPASAPTDDEESSDPAQRGIRSRRAAARRTVPFEPERIDRTLMRAAPFPPALEARPPVGAPGRTDPISSALHTGDPRDTFRLPAPDEPPLANPLATGDPRDTYRLAAPGEPPAAVTGKTAPPAGVPTPRRDVTERHATAMGPRGTFVLPDDDTDPTLPPGSAEAGAPTPMRWPDSAPVDVATSPSADQITPAPAPAIVGRYEVLLRIARGGMGTVYLCRVTGEGGFRRLFALKVIRDHLSASPEYVSMLLQEARIASRLHHPNVVSIVDIGTLANQHYLVMDYVEGCTFSELLKAHPKSRPPQLIVPIVIDALTGLHSAHTLTEDDGRPFPLVHCDFSPQNMLVGVGGICRITDFGISKAADALPERSGVTRGKPGYLSPEQILGRPIDHRSDIFSAGVVLWNALTGERLFEGPTPEATLQQVLDKPIPRPSSVGLRPPACFDAICLTALERDPERRYQTAEQMLVELRRAAVAHDYLAAQSDVAKWVHDTFGHQIELRRQAAGIAPRQVPGHLQAMSLSGVATAPGGHPSGERREGSDTGAFAAAGSRTAILRSDVSVREEGAAATEPPRQSQAGSRARAAVFVLSALAAGAIVAVLFVQPDLLRGGMLDDAGNYHPWTPPPPEGIGAPPTAGQPDPSGPTGGGPEPGPELDGGHALGDTDGATAGAGHEQHEQSGGTDVDAAEPAVPQPEPAETDPSPARPEDGKADAEPTTKPPRERPTSKDRAKSKSRSKSKPKSKPKAQPDPEPDPAAGGDAPPDDPAPLEPDPPPPAAPTPEAPAKPAPPAATETPAVPPPPEG